MRRIATLATAVYTGLAACTPQPPAAPPSMPSHAADGPSDAHSAASVAAPAPNAAPIGLTPDAGAPDAPASTAATALAGPSFASTGFGPQPPPERMGVAATGFPAISSDARRIAVTVEETRDMRDVPNLTLRVHDVATWRVEEELVLLSYAEGLDIDYSDKGRSAREALEARVASRVERANRIFAGRGWSSLARAVPDSDPPWQAKVQRSTASDLAIAYDAPKLTIADRGGRVLVSRAMAWELPSQRALSPGYGRCSYTPYLHASYVDRAAGVVLLLTGYSITHDACETKTLRWSVVRLPS